MPAEIKARPTLYKGIQMRSRLEADYAAHLDRTWQSWEYEPDCFAGPDGQWLPDFRVGGIVLQEVKPASLIRRREGETDYDIACRMDPILQRMLIARESEPEVPLELVFWSYGAQEPDLCVVGVSGVPWLAAVGSLPLLMWQGMGQFADAYTRLNARTQPGNALLEFADREAS